MRALTTIVSDCRWTKISVKCTQRTVKLCLLDIWEFLLKESWIRYTYIPGNGYCWNRWSCYITFRENKRNSLPARRIIFQSEKRLNNFTWHFKRKIWCSVPSLFCLLHVAATSGKSWSLSFPGAKPSDVTWLRASPRALMTSMSTCRKTINKYPVTQHRRATPSCPSKPLHVETHYQVANLHSGYRYE